MEVRTILWPTDLSKSSLKAAPKVNSLAEKYQAKVIVMYVGVDLMNQLMAYGYPSEDHIQNFQKWELEQARKKLETVCQEELKACPMFNVRMVQGDAATEILKAIKEEKADMVVRFSGGDNAGHTVINPFGEFRLHLVPSGIFSPQAVCIIGNGVVINPAVLIG